MNAQSDLSRGLKDVPILGPNIFLDDGNGDSVIDLGLSDNRPRLIVGHSLGFRSQLGSADLITTGTGKEHRTSAASLVLFGKDGSVIAPRDHLRALLGQLSWNSRVSDIQTRFSEAILCLR